MFWCQSAYAVFMEVDKMSGNADIESIMALKALFGGGDLASADNGGKVSDILNAAVPYMPQDKRRAMFYISKLMEVMEFGGGEITAFETQAQDKRTRREEFLKAVSPYLSDNDKNSIDTLVKVIELKKVMG